MRQLGLLLSIPALMVVAPLIGLLGGQWVDRRLRSDPWGAIVGVCIGFAAAVREIRNILRKAKGDSENRKP